MRLSLIIPVYNRPDEVEELLSSLSRQSDPDFEVVVVEDGSRLDSRAIAERYTEKLNIRYFFKENEGPGPTRNYGVRHTSADFYIFLDSDCVIPSHYIRAVKEGLKATGADAFGGPDRAHPSFTPIQKAISYTMTSFLTTGGIRGGKKKVDVFHPRSFNMGLSHKAFEATQGFARMRFGEDVDLSLRIIEAGFKAVLIPDAYVYHKRRTNFRQFFKQVHNSGIARINLHKRHPGSLKWVHMIPAAFVLYTLFSLLVLPFGWWPFMALLVFYLLLIFADAWRQNKSIRVGWLAVQAVVVQHFAYGLGFLKAVWRRLILGKGEFAAFEKNFYK